MPRIHILGASGSGTTTLGAVLAERLQVPFLDVDDYYWQRTDPPYREKHSPAERMAMIERDIAGQESWVLSGSLCNWGESLIDQFTLVVFLYLDATLRLERLRARERLRYGAAIEPGGPLHATHRDFLTWAASYETAAAPVRSLDLRLRWLQHLQCPVLKLDSAISIANLAEQVIGATMI